MATARRLPSGSWRVLAFDGTGPDGKRKYRSFTAPTKKQAEFEASLYRMKKRRAVSDLPTVGEAVERYIASKSSILSPSTQRAYKSLQRHAYGPIQDVRLDALSQEQLQSAVNVLAAKHKPKTVRNAITLLRSAAAMFDPDRKLSAQLPQRSSADVSLPGHADVVKLIDAARDGPMYIVLLLAAALGLRRSEICALEWRDVDQDAGTVRIRQAAVGGEGGVWTIKAPKTVSGARTIKAPGFLLDELKALRQPGEVRVTDLTPNAVTQRFIRLREYCGVSYRFHDLRHYYASLMLALGVPDKYAMQRLGHSTPGVLKAIYQHLMDDKQAEVDLAVNAKLTELFK